MTNHGARASRPQEFDQNLSSADSDAKAGETPAHRIEQLPFAPHDGGRFDILLETHMF